MRRITAMTPTSDERREVAATMRVISSEGVKHLTLGEVLNSILTGGAPRPTTEMAILARLADLIDPTCRDFGGEEGTNGEGYDFACSACGYVCDLAEPEFCPNCGARVVSDDDQ